MEILHSGSRSVASLSRDMQPTAKTVCCDNTQILQVLWIGALLCERVLAPLGPMVDHPCKLSADTLCKLLLR